MEKENSRIIEYDISKFIALFLVIIGHLSFIQIETNYGGIHYLSQLESLNLQNSNFNSFIGIITTIIYSFHMPLFIFLSGCIFGIKFTKYSSFKDLLKDKFLKLIIPFFFVSIFYSIPIKLISGYYDLSLGALTNIKQMILGQLLLFGNSHLWYVYALFAIFLIIYLVIKKIDINKISSNFIILMVFILFYFLSFLNISTLLITMPLRYLLFFYLGFLFEKNRNKINNFLHKKKSIIYIGLVSATLIFIPLFLLNNYCNHYVPTDFLTKLIRFAILKIISLFEALLGIIIIYLISYLLSKNTTIYKNNLFNKILYASFGIYLYSDPLNYLCLNLFFKIFGIESLSSDFLSFLLYFTRFVITFFISFIITLILKKLKIKYIC